MKKLLCVLLILGVNSVFASSSSDSIKYKGKTKKNKTCKLEIIKKLTDYNEIRNVPFIRRYIEGGIITESQIPTFMFIVRASGSLRKMTTGDGHGNRIEQYQRDRGAEYRLTGSSGRSLILSASIELELNANKEPINYNAGTLLKQVECLNLKKVRLNPVN
jgi:hypothetical protein